MRFSERETYDLVKAGFLLSLAFTILFLGGFNALYNFNILNFLTVFLIASLTVGIAFLSHEIMHKAVAQKYGFKAEFRAFDRMLWLAVIMSFFGFIIAAPGAVMIRAFKINKEKNGKISLAGPLTNIVLAVFFLIFVFLIKPEGILSIFFKYGFLINSLLALFNLIPIRPFDGSKVLAWNKSIYGLVTVTAAILFIINISGIVI